MSTVCERSSVPVSIRRIQQESELLALYLARTNVLCFIFGILSKCLNIFQTVHRRALSAAKENLFFLQLPVPVNTVYASGVRMFLKKFWNIYNEKQREIKWRQGKPNSNYVCNANGAKILLINTTISWRVRFLIKEISIPDKRFS